MSLKRSLAFVCYCLVSALPALAQCVAGTLPKQIDTLTLIPNVMLGGRFAFDDFRLEVAQPGGTWLSVLLTNGVKLYYEIYG